MNEKFKLTLESIIPFIILGIVIALGIGFFIMFSYVLVWGLLIGAVLWTLSFIKNLFFSNKVNNNLEKTKGRIIEHHDQE